MASVRIIFMHLYITCVSIHRNSLKVVSVLTVKKLSLVNLQSIETQIASHSSLLSTNSLHLLQTRRKAQSARIADTEDTVPFVALILSD